MVRILTWCFEGSGWFWVGFWCVNLVAPAFGLGWMFSGCAGPV